MKTRKELKEEYKNMKFDMGVFQIRNKVNGKVFIGSSVNLKVIWNRNRAQLNFNSHPNLALQQDWNTFGEASFAYEILEVIKQDEGEGVDYNAGLKALEAIIMEELQPYGDAGYHKKSGSFR